MNFRRILLFCILHADTSKCHFFIKNMAALCMTKINNKKIKANIKYLQILNFLKHIKPSLFFVQYDPYDPYPVSKWSKVR